MMLIASPVILKMYWDILAATIGKPLKRISKAVHSVVMTAIEEHSKKPIEIRDRIVELFGDLPRVELFARQSATGWDCWGNEAPNIEESLAAAQHTVKKKKWVMVRKSLL